MNKYEIIIFWSDVDGAYIVLWIKTAKKFGDPIPKPKGHRLVYA